MEGKIVVIEYSLFSVSISGHSVVAWLSNTPETKGPGHEEQRFSALRSQVGKQGCWARGLRDCDYDKDFSNNYMTYDHAQLS